MKRSSVTIIGLSILFLSLIMVGFGASRFSYHEGYTAKILDDLGDFAFIYALPAAITGIVILFLSFLFPKK
ncbi:MAG: hypothetical protein JWQ66_945 [Mucilaginibacter sp.]|nr:hypothetical protein [Mucilaginibacter sp.]